MSTKDIFIPKANSIQAPGNDFHWNFGDDPKQAEHTTFYRSLFEPTGEESWVFDGSTGSGDEENLYSFLLMVPYIDDNVLENTYKLRDGQKLHVSHTYSIPAPPGFTGFRVVDADDAELTIHLDPIKGTVQGDFNAVFKTHRMNPNGTFQLKRDDQ
ncbi:hypothetical protein [Pseudomonas sp. GL-B-19]|uniref:hypothetical protein n=1 Tax=Pseudomonas sp. GL-B-19 TaxID=2832393 RepID=UPI001CC109C3|nr:hypothetical protein [Pseudomonas sp. GL-B-19]